MSDITFRYASSSDMEEILKLQIQVFSGEQNIPAEDVPLPPERNAVWWCAEVNGAIAAAVASWEEHGRTHWGRFAVQPALRGKHIGTALARHSVEDLFSRGASEIHLTARESTVHIFCKMGGEIIGEPIPFFEGTVTPVILRKESYVN